MNEKALSTTFVKVFSVIITVFFSIYSQYIKAFQKAPETSKINKYDLLVDQFYKNETDSSVAVIYAKKYLDLAKKEKDTFRMMNGYYFFSILNKGNVSLKYSDSILQITRDKAHKSKDYPALGYLSKAIFYYDNGNFKNALDYFLKVNEEAEKYNDNYLLFTSKNSIGILKSRLGENKAALKILKESYIFFSEEKETYPAEYLGTLFALSDSYNRNKKLDSASMFNKLGYKESYNLKNESMSVYFTLNEGVNQYHSGRHVVAMDSIKKSINQLKYNEDSANLSIAHYYLGKTLSTLNFKEKAIEEFIKVDSIVQNISEIMPETRDGYEILINHFKKENDKNNQLKYIERLIKVDSIINSNYKYLIKSITQNYDTRQLIFDREKIISSLENDKKHSLRINIVISCLSLSLLVFLYLNYRKKRIYKKRFLKLYHEKQSITTPTNESIKKPTSDIGISNSVVDELLERINSFEANKDFLKPKLTISNLSKEFKTNPRYLSKIINIYKGKSFNNYINDLRIDYVVQKLKLNSQFRKYTIKAIGHEIGFNSTEVFSKSFYKKTGVYPSFFLKQLDKQN